MGRDVCRPAGAMRDSGRSASVDSGASGSAAQVRSACLAVVAPDLGHPFDHAAAEALAATLRGDQDLQRTEDVRRRRVPRRTSLLQPRRCLRRGGSRRLRSTPPGSRCPAHDLLALVVPRVEVELGVLGDHPVEEAFDDRVVVQELGPDPLLTLAYVVAGRCARHASETAASRQRGASHFRAHLATAAEISVDSGVIREHWRRGLFG